MRCPGCGYVGGSGITKQGRYWHADCWIRRLEEALARIAEGDFSMAAVTDEMQHVAREALCV